MTRLELIQSVVYGDSWVLYLPIVAECTELER